MSLVFIWAALSLQYSLKLSWDVSPYSATEEVAESKGKLFTHLIQKKKKFSIFHNTLDPFWFEPRDELRARDRWLDHLQGFSEVWFVRVMIEASQMQNLAYMQAEEDWVTVLDQAAAVVLEI